MNHIEARNAKAEKKAAKASKGAEVMTKKEANNSKVEQSGAAGDKASTDLNIRNAIASDADPKKNEATALSGAKSTTDPKIPDAATVKKGKDAATPSNSEANNDPPNKGAEVMTDKKAKNAKVENKPVKEDKKAEKITTKATEKTAVADKPAAAGDKASTDLNIGNAIAPASAKMVDKVETPANLQKDKISAPVKAKGPDGKGSDT